MRSDIVQQILRCGGEDDLDVRRTGWRPINRRAHRRRDILDACWVTKFVTAGGWPTVSGQIRRSQHAIFALIAVGATKDFTNLSMISRDLNPVTVTLSGGEVCADAATTGSISRMETATIRTIFQPDIM